MNPHSYYFNAEINDQSVAHCLGTLVGMSRRPEQPEVTLILNSPGGSVLQGLALYDGILSLRREGAVIDTLILGCGASMAGVIAQAGRVRRIGPQAYLMIHEVALGAQGSLSGVYDTLELGARLQRQCFDILAGRSRLRPWQIEEATERRDWWLDAYEALEHGFVDEILPVAV